MYRNQYPVFHEAWRELRRWARLAAGLILFFFIMELVRVYRVLFELHPYVAYGFAGICVLVGLILLIRRRIRRRGRQTLLPPHRPDARRLRHEDLVAYTTYLIHRLKGLGINPALSEEDQKRLRQRAYDLEALLSSHPLIEDLTRAISKAEDEVLEPALKQLDEKAVELGKAKIRFLMDDVVKPPFPLITPLVVLYHQVTLVTAVADIYLGRCTLRDYLRVLADVEEASRAGEFFRIGQRLFEGVYLNSPPLGAAVDELGQAITCTWLTWSITKMSAYRCRALTPWRLRDSVAWLDSQTEESLSVVRDVLVEDVLPMMKMRIRHIAGSAMADRPGFPDEVTQGLAKSVDAVVKSVRARNAAQAVQLSRRTLPGDAMTREEKPAPNRAWHRGGLLRSIMGAKRNPAE